MNHLCRKYVRWEYIDRLRVDGLEAQTIIYNSRKFWCQQTWCTRAAPLLVHSFLPPYVLYIIHLFFCDDILMDSYMVQLRNGILLKSYQKVSPINSLQNTLVFQIRESDKANIVPMLQSNNWRQSISKPILTFWQLVLSSFVFLPFKAIHWFYFKVNNRRRFLEEC